MSNGDKRISLRDSLLEAIEQVKDGTLEPAKASAVADLSEAVLNVDRFELDAMAFAAKCKREGLQFKSPALIEDRSDEPDGEQSEPPEEPEQVQVLADDEEIDLDELEKVVEENQPVKLEELSAITGLSKRDLFAALKDDRFERETSGVYWIAEK